MEQELSEIKNDVKEIKDALLGTPYTNNKGMIHDVDRNTTFRKKTGWISGLFLGLGFGLKAFWEWLKH